MKAGCRVFGAALASSALLALLALLASCAGSPAMAPVPAVLPSAPTAVPEPLFDPVSLPASPAEKAPPTRPKPTRFIPNAPGSVFPSVPHSVGVWVPDSGVAALRRVGLSAEFREAYLEATLRGVPLRGILGGDLVHFWKTPSRDRGFLPVGGGAYVQNWRDADAGDNAWGLRGLLLACRPAAGGRVSLVRGQLLDAYSRGGGVGGANGIAGYGAPLGDEFRLTEGIAQRFEYGLLLAGPEGVSFIPGEAPSSRGVPEDVGAPSPSGVPGALRVGAQERQAIRSAWISAVNSGRDVLESDGPVFYSEGAWGGAWAQTFGSGLWGIVLASDSSQAGSRAKILDAPFLASVRAESGGGLDFGEYGLPLTDSFPASGGLAQIYQKGRVETQP